MFFLHHDGASPCGSGPFQICSSPVSASQMLGLQVRILLKPRWWASLRLCHKQGIALAFVSSHKLESVSIKAAKSNWPVHFQPSLVLKNTFVSGSKRQETTQALRSGRLSQVGPSRLTLPVQAVTLGNRTHCQCPHVAQGGPVGEPSPPR